MDYAAALYIQVTGEPTAQAFYTNITIYYVHKK